MPAQVRDSITSPDWGTVYAAKPEHVRLYHPANDRGLRRPRAEVRMADLGA